MRRISSSGADASIAAQSDGRFVVAGTSGANVRAWAMGLDAQGEVLWSQSFTGEHFARVRATEDGGYVLAGKVVEAFDISVVKLDAEGELQWARTVDNLFDPDPAEGDFIATSDDRAFDIAEKPGGGYVVVGDAYGNFPLPEHVGDRRYLEELDEAIAVVHAFRPVALVVSLGLDIAKADPTGTWRISPDGLFEIGRRIGAMRYPTLLVQEGGYNIRSLGRNATRMLTGVCAGALGRRRVRSRK